MKKNGQVLNFVNRFLQDIGNRSYLCQVLRCQIKAMSAGKLDLNVRLFLQLTEADFFVFFNSPVFADQIFAELKNLEIRPLPVPEKDGVFTGLVGHDWKLDIHLSDDNTHVGEPVSLQIKISGTQEPTSFIKQELSFPDFRVYPPEWILQNNSGICRYTLIPLKEGNLPVSLKVSTFDPVSGNYVVSDFQQNVKVQKAIAASLPEDLRNLVDFGKDDNAGTEVQNESPQNNISYLYADPGEKVLIPLYRNTLYTACILGMSGFLIFIMLFFYAGKRKIFHADPVLQRRISAKSRKKRLLKKLKNLPAGPLPDPLCIELTEYLNDLLGRSGGTSLEEIAGSLKEQDPELAGILQQIARNSWQPDHPNDFSPAMKQILLKRLSKLSILLLCLTVPCRSFSGETALQVKSPDATADSVSFSVSTANEALKAYDNGHFQKALSYYLDQLWNQGSSAGLLYNIGNCYLQLGDLPQALVAYERASLLAPRDQNIRKNMNLVRHQLLLPPGNTGDTPGTMLLTIRDMLRLDEWIMIAGICTFIMFCGLGAGFFVRKYLWIPPVCVSAVILLLSVLAVFSQNRSIYRGDRGIILDRKVNLYSMPSRETGKMIRYLKAGEEVRILEKRLQWCRIKAGNEEGWIDPGHLAVLWTPDLSAGFRKTDIVLPENESGNLDP